MQKLLEFENWKRFLVFHSNNEIPSFQNILAKAENSYGKENKEGYAEKQEREKREREEKEKEDKSGRPVEIPIIDPPRSPSIPTTEEILKYPNTVNDYKM